MAFRKFVSLERSPREKADAMNGMMGMPAVPDYPPGFSFSMDEVDLEKLDIDDKDIDVGDTIHFAVMARVTSVSKRQIDGKDCCRVELQGEEVEVEMPPENKEDAE